MTDWLIQRHIPNAPNSDSGAWVDEGIARDLKADQAEQAVAQAADPAQAGERRATKWEHVSTHELTPGPPVVTTTTKHFDEQPKTTKGGGG